ncbi:unnamed protein product [Caenorhabditis brenneri]
MDKFPLRNQTIINFLKTRQNSFECFEIYSETGSDRDLKYLLDNLKTDRFLTVLSKIDDDFEVELPENLEDLSIRCARFVKFEQLLRLKSQRISLKSTSLTPREINAFLRSWMSAESHSNLEFFMIAINFETANEILLDIPHEIEDVMEVRAFEYENVIRHVRGGVTIKRIDGRSARIVPHLHLNSTYMQMYIY